MVHCAAWTAVDLAEDEDKTGKSTSYQCGQAQRILQMPARRLDAKMVYILVQTMYSTARERESLGTRL